MQLKFLDAFSQSAEITEQPIFLLARQGQEMKRAGNHPTINHRAKQDEQTRTNLADDRLLERHLLMTPRALSTREFVPPLRLCNPLASVEMV